MCCLFLSILIDEKDILSILSLLFGSSCSKDATLVRCFSSLYHHLVLYLFPLVLVGGDGVGIKDAGGSKIHFAGRGSPSMLIDEKDTLSILWLLDKKYLVIATSLGLKSRQVAIFS